MSFRNSSIWDDQKRYKVGEKEDNDPSLFDKLDLLFTDVETEGKKQGYERAAREYESLYLEIENKYSKYINYFKDRLC